MGFRVTSFPRSDGKKGKMICVLFMAMLLQPSSAILMRSGFMDYLTDITSDEMEQLTTALWNTADAIDNDADYGPGVLSTTTVYLAESGLTYMVMVWNWNRNTCNLGRGGEAKNPIALTPGTTVRNLLFSTLLYSVESLLFHYMGYGFAIEGYISLIYFPVIPAVAAILGLPSDNDPSSHQHGGPGTVQNLQDLTDSGNWTVTLGPRGKDSVPPANSSSSFNGTTFFARSDNFTKSHGVNHTASNTVWSNGTMVPHRKFPIDPNGDCDIPSLVLTFGMGPSVDDENTHGLHILNPTDKIWSPNTRFGLVMQTDCNLVLYDHVAETSLWSSDTYDQGSVCYAAITMYGELVVYDKDPENVLFRTRTWCSSFDGQCWTNTILEVQDDGNLVLYFAETGVAMWNSNTVQCDGGC